MTVMEADVSADGGRSVENVRKALQKIWESCLLRRSTRSRHLDGLLPDKEDAKLEMFTDAERHKREPQQQATKFPKGTLEVLYWRTYKRNRM